MDMKSLKQLSKGFVVAKKRRVHSGKSWLAVGLLVGVVAGVTYVANKTGQFDSTFAAEGFTMTGKLSYFGPVIPNRTMLGVRTQVNGDNLGAYIIKEAPIPFYEGIDIAGGADSSVIKSPKANAFGFTEALNTGEAGTVAGTLSVLKNSQIYYVIPGSKTLANFGLTLANTTPVATFQARTSVDDGTLVNFIVYNGGTVSAGTNLTFKYKNTATVLGIWMVPTIQSENGSTATVTVTDADKLPLANMPVTLRVKARIGNEDIVVGTGTTNANGQLTLDLSSWLSPAIDYKSQIFTLSTVWGPELKVEKKNDLSPHELLNGKGNLVIPMAKLNASFTGPAIVQAGAKVTFDAGKSSVNAGKIVGYYWNTTGEELDSTARQNISASDGPTGPIIIFNKGKQKEDVRFPLSAVGKTVTVRLRVVDSNNQIAYAQQDVNVIAPTVTTKAPTPITATIRVPAKVKANQTVNFTAVVKGVPAADASYSWYYGDEISDSEVDAPSTAEATVTAQPTSVSKTPTYQYQNAGTYTVTLLVTNNKTGQAAAPATARITVSDGTVADAGKPDFIIKKINFGTTAWMEGQIPPKFTVEVENLNPGTYVGEIEVGVRTSVLAKNASANAFFSRGYELSKAQFVAGSNTAIATFTPDTKIPSPIPPANAQSGNGPGVVKATLWYPDKEPSKARKNNNYVSQITVVKPTYSSYAITPELVGPTKYREAHKLVGNVRGGIRETVILNLLNRTTDTIPAGTIVSIDLLGKFVWLGEYSGPHMPTISANPIGSSCAFSYNSNFGSTNCSGEIGTIESNWYNFALLSDIPPGGRYKVSDISFLITYVCDTNAGTCSKHEPTGAFAAMVNGQYGTAYNIYP